MAAANSLPFDVFSQLSGAGFGSASNQPAVPGMGSNDLAASQTYALLAAALQQQQQQQQQQASQQQQVSQQMQQQQQQQQQQQPTQQHQQSSQSSFPHLSGYLAQQAGLAQAGLADALHPLLSSLDQQQLGQQSTQQSQQAQPLSQSTAGAQSSQHADHQELLAHLQNQAAAQQSQQQAQQQQQLQQFLQQQQYAALLSSLIPNASPQTPDRQPQSFPSAAYQSPLDPSGQTDSSRLATLQLQLQLLQQQQAAQQQQQGFSQLQAQPSGAQSPHQLAAAVAAAASLGRPMSPYSPILDPFTANTHPNARNLLLQQAYANAARHTSLGGQAGFDLAAARNSPQGWRAPFSPGRLSGIDSDAESVTSRGSRGFADLLGSAYDSDSALSTNSPSNGKNDAKKGGKPIRIKAARSGPKNPRSAYVFYVAEQRHKLAKAADLHTKSFRDVAMMVGQQWRELSAEDRRPYEEQARLDKERYLREKRENELREGKRSLNLNPVALAGVGGDASSPLSSRATTSTNGTPESHAFHRLRTPPTGTQPTSRATVQVNAAQRMASQARTLDLSTVATASGESSVGRPSVSTEGAVAGSSDNSNPSPSAVSTSTASSLSSAPTASETPDVSSSAAMVNVPPPPRVESPLLGIKRKAPSDDEDPAPSAVDSAGSAAAPAAPAAEPASDKSSGSESAKVGESAESSAAESEQPETKRVRTEEGEVKNEASS